MNKKKIYTVLCGLLLTAVAINAQQNMYVLNKYGSVVVTPTTQIDYATFEANNNWFTITNDSIVGIRDNLITATCTVAVTTDGAIKTLSATPEIGVCYSKKRSSPQIEYDLYQKLGTEMGSYTFSLSYLSSGTTYYYRIYMKLGNDVFYGDVCSVQTLGTKPEDHSKTINGHKFIDLALPSGLLWAETNIDAPTAADDGSYFAWGETTTKENYDRTTNKYYDTSTHSYTKYTGSNGDNKTVLETIDDAAYVNWGTPCRMPTKAEFDELHNTANCTWTWTSMTSFSGGTIKGYKIASNKNDNSIFLPASGYCENGRLYSHGSSGDYWSSTLHNSRTNNAYYLSFSSSGHGSGGDHYRLEGFPIRPVSEP